MQLEGEDGDTPQLEEGEIAMAAEKIKVAADPRRAELTKIARDHKDLVVQVIRAWLKEEKQRLKLELVAKQGS
jgi:flagellar biosynthesis/type III secretory pathway M-ring protein FliF/YscJ